MTLARLCPLLCWEIIASSAGATTAEDKAPVVAAVNKVATFVAAFY